ncbi:hypothetical protein B0H14DRAFT_3448199 [Mycena olivaceomarginata]|nr:hypothetical protein B0H14DRAFT_3448199 [Mycena olivaceomarginata]
MAIFLSLPTWFRSWLTRLQRLFASPSESTRFSAAQECNEDTLRLIFEHCSDSTLAAAGRVCRTWAIPAQQELLSVLPSKTTPTRTAQWDVLGKHQPPLSYYTPVSGTVTAILARLTEWQTPLELLPTKPYKSNGGVTPAMSLVLADLLSLKHDLVQYTDLCSWQEVPMESMSSTDTTRTDPCYVPSAEARRCYAQSQITRLVFLSVMYMAFHSHFPTTGGPNDNTPHLTPEQWAHALQLFHQSQSVPPTPQLSTPPPAPHLPLRDPVIDPVLQPPRDIALDTRLEALEREVEDLKTKKRTNSDSDAPLSKRAKKRTKPSVYILRNASNLSLSEIVVRKQLMKKIKLEGTRLTGRRNDSNSDSDDDSNPPRSGPSLPHLCYDFSANVDHPTNTKVIDRIADLVWSEQRDPKSSTFSLAHADVLEEELESR